jgi:DNA-directed RNA polymerase subunit RPC12/RpoP
MSSAQGQTWPCAVCGAPVGNANLITRLLDSGTYGVVCPNCRGPMTPPEGTTQETSHDT